MNGPIANCTKLFPDHTKCQHVQNYLLAVGRYYLYTCQQVLHTLFRTNSTLRLGLSLHTCTPDILSCTPEISWKTVILCSLVWQVVVLNGAKMYQFGCEIGVFVIFSNTVLPKNNELRPLCPRLVSTLPASCLQDARVLPPRRPRPASKTPASCVCFARVLPPERPCLASKTPASCVCSARVLPPRRLRLARS